MSAHANPDIVDDNLVFMYDTDDGKSYKGEPTTNVNTFTLSDSGTDGSGQSSVGTRTIITDNHVRIVDVASNTRQSHLITGLTASTTYTVSIRYKKLVGTPTFRFQIQDYSGSSYLRTIKFTNTSEIGIEDVEGWQLASWTFTLGSDANAVRIWYQDGADYTTYTHSFELKNPQLEAKSHATPFVDGTRSATQGLIDRTGTSTIDISNASFDSNAQMTFDGTDDRIYTSEDISFGNNTTWEAWVNRTASVNSYNMFMGRTLPYFGLRSNQIIFSNYIGGNQRTVYSNGFTPSNNTWYHLIFTTEYDDTNITSKIYINGVFNNSRTDSGQQGHYSQGFAIGEGRDNASWYPFNGKVSNVKIYDKTLTASQIRQNFNATKSRFQL